MGIVGIFGGCKGCASAFSAGQIAPFLIIGAAMLVVGIIISRSKRK